jgi:hypothetical protein
VDPLGSAGCGLFSNYHDGQVQLRPATFLPVKFTIELRRLAIISDYLVEIKTMVQEQINHKDALEEPK